MHTRHHRLGHLLDECHQFGAGDKQRTNRRQVGIGDIGEIVPGAEHRAVARKDYAQGVTVPDVAEGCDQLAHVLQQQPRFAVPFLLDPLVLRCWRRR